MADSDLPPGTHRGDAAFGPRLAAFIARAPARIVVVALLIGGLASLLAMRLGIDPELRAMLPDDAPTVLRLDAVAARIGNQSDLYVTIRSPSRAANLAFGAEIAATLARRPDIRHVVFKRDASFFRANALLYARLDDLLALRSRVIAAIQASVRRELGAFGDEAPPVELGLAVDEAELRRRYHLEDGPSEYYEGDEGRVLVIRARPTRPNTDLRFARTPVYFRGLRARGS